MNMKLSVFTTLACLTIFSTSAPALSDMSEEEFEAAANAQFSKSHRDYAPNEIPTDATRQFQANYNFPTSPPSLSNRPWLSIDPRGNWERYLNSVLMGAFTDCGAPEIDWDGTKCNWYHAPWFHDAREYINGLTRERSSRIAEAHPNQNRRFANYAVGLYNDLGGYGFHKIWKDKARPKTKNFQFPEGTVSVKLLFSTATVEDVPYLRYAKEWDALVDGEIHTVRIFQLDVAVKDRRAGHTGWFFGTYFYNGSIELPRCNQPNCETARWIERMVPIGIQWGNDPNLTRTTFNAGGRPVESVLSPDVAEMFRLIRVISGHPPYLGRYHRMNGPVDNPRSACMACHMRAVDFGRPGNVPFTAPWDASEEQEKMFFRNLSPKEPFVEGAQSLDYSLQASIGINAFRQWVNRQDISDQLKRQTRDVPVVPQAQTNSLMNALTKHAIVPKAMPSSLSRRFE